MRTQDKKSSQDEKPFQIIHRFIASVKEAHRFESVRKSGNMNFFSDDELLVIAHLEQAANDVRHANIKLIQRAKKIISKSSFMPVPGNPYYKRFLLGAIELLLIEAKIRKRNPALYDFLYHDTLWYFDNKDKIPVKIKNEIDIYLTEGFPYETPDDDRKLYEEFKEIVEYYKQRPLSVKEFIYEKIRQMPDYQRNDFISSRNVKDLVVKWYDEYVKAYTRVSMHTFENRACEVKRKLRKEREKNG